MSYFKTLTVALAASIAAASLATANAQQGASHYNGVANVPPAVAAKFNNAAYRTIQGQMMGVASYAPNGECGVTIGGRKSGRRMSATACRYSVEFLGNGRIRMSSTVTMNGQTMTDSSTLQMRRDGSLFDEKYRTVMVRIG